MRFLGTTRDAIGNGLASVVDAALARGAPRPAWIAVDDGTDQWVTEAAGCSSAERACGVVAALDDGALVTAQRFGIGGAMWLPPSSIGALDAFTAADCTAASPEGCDAAVLELSGVDAERVLVTFVDRGFWRAQLGERQLTAILVELAVALDVPAAILPWPALVVSAREIDDVVEAARLLISDADRLLPDMAVAPLGEIPIGEGILEAAYRELLQDRLPYSVIEGEHRWLPVHELPRGRRVGWWSRQEFQAKPDEGWLLFPEPGSPNRRTWRLEGMGASGVVDEVLTSEELEGVAGPLAVRLPGWASRDIRPGTPAGLLVTRLAEAAVRRGLPLWIPHVDGDALRLVLGLPGVLWVDGPAVPP